MKLNTASESRLRGVHPDLVRVVRRCAADWKDPETGFIVTCGTRTLEEQRLLYAKGATRTMRSRHLTGHAVDLAATVQGQVRWDWSLYIKIANAMKAAAKAEKVPVRWGGSWSLLNTVKGPITSAMLSKSFPDGPHYELPHEVYSGAK